MVYYGLLAHFVGDFLLQTKGLSELKKRRIVLGNFIHGSIVLLANVLIFLIALRINSTVINVVIIVTASHFVIDLLKSLIIKIYDNPNLDLVIYIIDQILHLLVVLVLFSLYFDNSMQATEERVSFLMSIYIFVLFFGDITIRKTFRAIRLPNYEKREVEIKGVGSLIGKIERLIILTMILLAHPEVAIAIIGVKSIARFPEFNNQSEKNNDYFILGNLLSILFVIIGYGLFVYLPKVITYFS